MTDSKAPKSEIEPKAGLLSLFGDVRPGETVTVLLMLLNIFLILAGYYICNTVREPLILSGGGAEVKSYASAGQAVVLMGFIPLYSWFSSRVDRVRLIFGVTLFFILNVELFWLLVKMGTPYVGVAFFIWVGIFNNAIIAQFWSYGNDIYPVTAGERLFPVIGIGATLGSPVGSWLAARLFSGGVPAYTMLHITAAVLLVTMGIYWVVERRQGQTRQRGARGNRLKVGEGGFLLLARSPYLRLICLLLILLNLVNTTGQYVLDTFVLREATARVAADPSLNKEALLGAFYGDYYWWVNILGVVIQALVASRIVKYLGIAGALMALPIVALSSYSMVVAGATLILVKYAKIAENATDYSIMNTARQMLWLPTSREEKYKAKQAADTFIVRVGDMASAGLVFVGTTFLEFGPRGFAGANVVICLAWLGVGVLLLRYYRSLSVKQVPQADAA